jgi:hypothetical protein
MTVVSTTVADYTIPARQPPYIAPKDRRQMVRVPMPNFLHCTHVCTHVGRSLYALDNCHLSYAMCVAMCVIRYST